MYDFKRNNHAAAPRNRRELMITSTAEPDQHTGNHEDLEYDAYLLRLRERFTVNTSGGPVFETDAADLFPLYLSTFDEGERQFHNCHACRQFIERFGGLATIGDDGVIAPAIWSEEDAPTIYKPGIAAMSKAIRRAKVTGQFLSADKVWGTPKTGVWRHLSVERPAFVQRGIHTASQVMAEKREDFKTVMHALNEFTQPIIEQALTLLRNDSLYRSEKVLGQAEWLYSLHVARAVAHGNGRANVVWSAIATAPAGFCHPRSSMIGTLLEDIAAGMEFSEVSRRFAAKMHPLQYQRPQAAPSAGTIAQAEKLVEQMGIAPALRRRYARLDDVEALWSPEPARAPASGGVFGHLAAKGEVAPAALVAPPVTMTWDKFQRTVLPDAASIEFKCGRDNYTTLVTAADPEAPPILQWDREDLRNPVSGYVWHGGSDPSQYGLPGGFNAVSAIALQPHMWNGGSSQSTHQSLGVIFLLKGAKESRSAGLALFPEILRAELHPVRAVIEAHSKSGQIEGMEQASATGVTPSKGGNWSAVIRVTTKAGQVSQYKLDRWD